MHKHLPNLLTVFRLILTGPLLLMFCWVEGSPKIHNTIIFLVALAALTDCVDGWFARRFNCISDFGKIHDPLADKWLVVLYMPIVALGMIHFLPVAILWLRDITATYLRSQKKKVVPAKLSGKIKTIISFPLLCLLIAALPVKDSYFSFLQNWHWHLYWIGGWTLSLVCIWSGLDYYYQMMIKKEPVEPPTRTLPAAS